MSRKTTAVESYAHLWDAGRSRYRWVIWHTAGETLVFDRETNCLADTGDESLLPEVLRRMREAGVPETDDYPGRPCG